MFREDVVWCVLIVMVVRAEKRSRHYVKMSCLSADQGWTHETRRDVAASSATRVEVRVHHFRFCHWFATYSSPIGYGVGDSRPVKKVSPLHSHQDALSIDDTSWVVQRSDYQATWCSLRDSVGQRPEVHIHILEASSHKVRHTYQVQYSVPSTDRWAVRSDYSDTQGCLNHVY